jgi:hypothetical protein
VRVRTTHSGLIQIAPVQLMRGEQLSGMDALIGGARAHHSQHDTNVLSLA